MHVVLVLDHAHINGGQAKVAIKSALGLRQRGHAVTLFAAVAPVDPRLDEAGVKVVCLGQDDVHSTRNKLAFAAQVVWNSSAAKALRGLLRGPTRPTPSSTCMAGRRRSRPRSGRCWPRPGCRCLHHARVLPRLPERRLLRLSGREDLPSPADVLPCHRPQLRFEELSAQARCASPATPRSTISSGMKEAIRHVVLISRLQEEVAGRYFPSSTVFHRVDNPIAVPELGPKPEGPPGDFLFVGRLSPEKGAADLRRGGARRGREARPRRRRRRAPRRCVCATRKPRSSAGSRPAEVLGADARGAGARLPVGLVRGAAAGDLRGAGCTPVIVSDACAGREAVSEGENGFWFRSGDVAALAARLAALSTTPRRGG